MRRNRALRSALSPRLSLCGRFHSSSSPTYPWRSLSGEAARQGDPTTPSYLLRAYTPPRHTASSYLEASSPDLGPKGVGFKGIGGKRFGAPLSATGHVARMLPTPPSSIVEAGALGAPQGAYTGHTAGSHPAFSARLRAAAPQRGHFCFSAVPLALYPGTSTSSSRAPLATSSSISSHTSPFPATPVPPLSLARLRCTGASPLSAHHGLSLAVHTQSQGRPHPLSPPKAVSPDSESTAVCQQSAGGAQREHAEVSASDEALGPSKAPEHGPNGHAHGKKVPFESNDPYMYLAGALGPEGGGMSPPSSAHSHATSEASLPLHRAEANGSAAQQSPGIQPAPQPSNGYALIGRANGATIEAVNGTASSHMESLLSGAPAAHHSTPESALAEEASKEELENEAKGQGRTLPECVAGAEAEAEAEAQVEAQAEAQAGARVEAKAAAEAAADAWATAAVRAHAAAAEAAIVAVVAGGDAGAEPEGGAPRSPPRRPKGMILMGGRRGKNSDLLGVPGVGPRNLEKLKASGIKEVATLTKVYREKTASECGVEAMVEYLRRDVGVRKDHAALISTFAKHKVDEEGGGQGEGQEEGGEGAEGGARRGTKRLTFCVEGNISVGKSTLLRKVAGQLLLHEFVEVVPEPIEQWQDVGSRHVNVLNEFYGDPAKYAYTFQNYVFVTRVMQSLNTREGPQPLRLMERSIFSDRMVFVRAVHEAKWLDDVQLSVYDSSFDPFVRQLPGLVPDAFIYLRAEPTTCHERLLRRAREEESTVSLDYLTSLHEKHEGWLYPHLQGLGGGLERGRLLNGGAPSTVLVRPRWPGDLGSTPVPENLKGRVFGLGGPDVHPSIQNIPALVLDCNHHIEFGNDLENWYSILAQDIKMFFDFVKGMKEGPKSPGPGLLNAERCLSEYRHLQAAGSL